MWAVCAGQRTWCAEQCLEKRKCLARVLCATLAYVCIQVSLCDCSCFGARIHRWQFSSVAISSSAHCVGVWFCCCKLHWGLTHSVVGWVLDLWSVVCFCSVALSFCAFLHFESSVWSWSFFFQTVVDELVIALTFWTQFLLCFILLYNELQVLSN